MSKPKVEYYLTLQKKKWRWNWRVRAANGLITGQSTQGFANESKARDGFNRFARSIARNAFAMCKG